MMKVGRDYIKIGEKERKFSYRDILYDPDGWGDTKKYLPADYDLMLLKIKDKKISYGWIFMTKWEGLKIKQDDEILYWKKNSD